MHLNDLPQDLRSRYTELQKSYTNFKNDLHDYHMSKIPRYLSVPQFFTEHDIQVNYQEMRVLSDMARIASIRQMKPIRTGSSEIGMLFCFLEEILEDCYSDMTANDGKI